MASSYKGYVLDPLKCSKLSMEEKRELVYEISKGTDDDHKMLQSLSRQELSQILCAETGIERKYATLPKMKIIERLMSVMTKTLGKRTTESHFDPKPSALNSQNTSKRQRKSENPSRHPIENVENANYCQNPACRDISLDQEVQEESWKSFCKFCSCFICYQYDENKDPSLWLFCSSKPPYEDSCDMQCHLECALKQERAIALDGHDTAFDISFDCVCCGKVIDMLRCLKNQLLIARDTVKLEVLCHRLFLSQKLLKGTKKYQKIDELVDEAVRKLGAKVGLLSVNMVEGNLSSLGNGIEAQKLCASAVKSLDSVLSCGILLPSNLKLQDSNLTPQKLIKFENLSATSITVFLDFEDTSIVGWYDLWLRRKDMMDYPAEPTCSLFAPKLSFSFFGLSPNAEYILKIVSFRNMKELETWEVRFTTNSSENSDGKGLLVERGSSSTNCSSLSNPSEGDESNNLLACVDKIDNPEGNHFSYYKKTEIPNKSKFSDGACKNTRESQNKSTDTRREETPETSDSAVNDECIIEEVKSTPNLNVEPHNDLPKLEEGNQSSDVQLKNSHLLHSEFVKESIMCTESNNPAAEGLEIVPFEYGSDDTLPSNPCEVEIEKGELGKGWRLETDILEVKSLSWKTQGEQEGSSLEKKFMRGRECTTDRCLEEEYVHCVKVIRSLERRRYIEKNFREKFLSWYSLRATKDERRAVKMFVDTLNAEPISLSGKLVEIFSERIFSMRPLSASSGFCVKLWH
ncbi:Vin3-like protein [Thalictrum thalictroides]|uniref:Vin3-like protein n=1 Tax=Thalictrum thalictroides TaxID=46969 RepID=A0A7J6XAC4_THATH|nr:Vin3-like protein [Thalictrum thalictroides]